MVHDDDEPFGKRSDIASSTAPREADPEVLTIVPKTGFAKTFDHGSGVSRSPSSTTTYSRPSGVNPPKPFSITS